MSFKLYQNGVIQGLPTTIIVEKDNISVMQLFDELSSLYQIDIEGALISDDGKTLGDELFMLINGININKKEGLSTIIPANSEVLFSVIIAGG